MTGVEARKLDRDSLEDGQTLQAISLTKKHQQKALNIQQEVYSAQTKAILPEKQLSDLANMVYMTNSDLSESIRIMTVPPKTIEIHVTENEFDPSHQPMDDSKLTDQHKTSSQAMMKIPTPLQSTYLPNVPEQPSHRYLLGATLSDKESDVKLSTSFNNKQRSKTKNVRN